MGPVDPTAPFYDVTAKSAAITRATAEKLTDGPAPSAESGAQPLQRGQLIVIRGIDTQLYIPPSGVDIVPELLGPVDTTTSGALPGASRSARALVETGSSLRDWREKIAFE